MLIVEIIVIAIVVLGFGILAGDKGRYRYHERIPYRRYCLDCGQQQDQYEPNDQWCPMGRIHKETCHCHKDTK